MKNLLLFTLLLVLTASGIAQDSSRFTSFDKNYEYKNPTKAFLLSMGVTVGSVLAGQQLVKNNQSTVGGVFIVSGLLIGPSSGNIYVGNTTGISKGLVTRLLAGGAAVAGVYLLLLDGLGDAFGGSPNTGLEFIGNTLFYGGVGLLIYSTLYDWISSAEYAKKLNKKRSALQITPGFDTRTNTPTLGFKLRF